MVEEFTMNFDFELGIMETLNVQLHIQNVLRGVSVELSTEGESYYVVFNRDYYAEDVMSSKITEMLNVIGICVDLDNDNNVEIVAKIARHVLKAVWNRYYAGYAVIAEREDDGEYLRRIVGFFTEYDKANEFAESFGLPRHIDGDGVVYYKKSNEDAEDEDYYVEVYALSRDDRIYHVCGGREKL